MRNGRLILGAAAFICTAVSALGVKDSKFTGGIQCYTTVFLGLGSCRAVPSCHTINGHVQGRTRCGVGSANLYTLGGTQVVYCTRAN